MRINYYISSSRLSDAFLTKRFIGVYRLFCMFMVDFDTCHFYLCTNLLNVDSWHTPSIMIYTIQILLENFVGRLNVLHGCETTYGSINIDILLRG